MLISIRNFIISFLYKYILKPIFFLNDPEVMHDRMMLVGKRLGKHTFIKKVIKLLFNYENKKLEQNILGISFKNPIGLSAGFDKDAELTDIIPNVGFGFEEVGSITANSCEGNPKPRLWRLKKSKSLIVYYGLKNKGAKSISESLKNKKFDFPVGISIAKTNSIETCDTEKGIEDYIETYRLFSDIGDYFTLNISCPNTFGGQPFTDKEKLNSLLKQIFKLPKTKPIFIKLSPDLSPKEIDEIIEVSDKYKIDGFVISNLTKNRNNKEIKDVVPTDKGGISGKVVKRLSNRAIRYVYKKTKGKYILIGCGGVSSAEEAYEKIKSGASLIQLITGMVYEGPQVISEINRKLVKLLEKDGYTNISQAVGSYYDTPSVF